MASRLERQVSDDPPISLYVATAEDTVAHKMFWYRKTDDTSTKQWRDLMGVLKSLGDRLDLNRLRLNSTSARHPHLPPKFCH
jgi:hypothetical protein